jgi:hypothetical protein
MSNDAKNFVLFATGATGTGKTHLTADIGRRFPRRLIFDSMGELGDIPAAVSVWTLADTLAELRKAAQRSRWAIVARLSPADTITVMNCIAPAGSLPEDSFTYKVGGVCIEHSECSLIAPPHTGIDAGVMGAISYGRHFKISALLAARRPTEVNKIVTSQAHVIAAFQQHEPRDIDYLESTVRRGIGEYIAKLREYEYVRLLTRARTLSIVDRNGRVRL